MSQFGLVSSGAKDGGDLFGHGEPLMRKDLDFLLGVDALEPLPEVGVVGGIDGEVGGVADVEVEQQVRQTHLPPAEEVRLHLTQQRLQPHYSLHHLLLLCFRPLHTRLRARLS
jgi:hypothetical protein